MSFEDTVAAATEQGLTVRIPTPSELFLDLDTKADYDHFLKTIPSLPGVKTWSKGPSKSGYPKCHVVVQMHYDVTNEQRILLQACLGSDRLHELLSYLASKSGNPAPSVFFEKR